MDGRVALALAAVYVIWGSTYLAIRFAIETLPPFLMAGTRFLIAGAVLFLWARRRAPEKLAARQWRSAAIIGALLLLFGNGGVVWAEQHLPSGLTALLVAMVPLWMASIDWLRPGGARPRPAVALGLVIGFAGVYLLVGPGEIAGAAPAPPLAVAVLVLATLGWASGSIYARHAPLPDSPWLATGMEMLAGGAFLTALGLARGELARFDLAALSARSLGAFAYLVVFGSLVGFTAYVWLLAHTSTARASTYAYVNPVVAMLLGWGFGDERLAPRTLLAAAVILAAVALIATTRSSPSRS